MTVLEALPRLLARSMPPAVSAWVGRMHGAQGVDIRTGVRIESLRRAGDGAVLSGPGWRLEADLVVAGIGIVPNVELAADAGLAVDDGITVDSQCRTSDPAIFAAGEVTARPLQLGVPRRVESWRSSTDQGAVAAQAMLGGDVHFDDVPSLWSDQYETNIQAVGFPELAARHEVLGDPQSNAWTWVALDEAGVVIGGIAINRGRDAAGLRRAVKQRAGLAFLLPRQSPHARPIRWLTGNTATMSEAGDWHDVAAITDLPPGEMLAFQIGSDQLAIYNVDGMIYATDDVCSHAYALLTDGWLEGAIVECPLHGGQFDVSTGKAVCDPAEADIRIVPVRIEGGRVFVRVTAAG